MSLEIAPGSVQEGPGATENAFWAVLGHPGACRPRPGGAPATSEAPQKPPKASKHRPRSAPGRPKDPKGHGRSAPGSLGLALLGRQRAAELVSGAFAEIDVFPCKFNGFGGFGPPRIVAGGTGQRRCRQFWGLASSVWGRWRFGCESWGALGHWAGRPWGVLEQNNLKGLLRVLVDPKPPVDFFV